MKLNIQHQNEYSRIELLLRTFFGWFYIMIPHGICLFLLGIPAGILVFIAFWIVLFTGKYPEKWYNFIVKLIKWDLRVYARMFNLVDGYPQFGLDVPDEKASFEQERPEKLNQIMVLIRILFGWIYVGIPHGFCLFFRIFASEILALLAWFVVLFTGKYPESWHSFNVGTIRWYARIVLYMGFMTDDYPQFSGKK